MYRIEVKCNVNGQPVSVPLYLGYAAFDQPNPVLHQMQLLSKERGVNLPNQVVEDLIKLNALAKSNNLDFLELCNQVFNQPALQAMDAPNDLKQITNALESN